LIPSYLPNRLSSFSSRAAPLKSLAMITPWGSNKTVWGIPEKE